MPNVKSIEPDTKVYASIPVGLNERALTTQSPAEYGLARISHRARTGTGYVYDTTAGSGTYVYVIDTGVSTSHSEFGGRATAVSFSRLCATFHHHHQQTSMMESDNNKDGSPSLARFSLT